MKNICLHVLALLITLNPLTTVNALSLDQVGVPKSPCRRNFLDKNSVQRNQDGSKRVFSIFIPKRNSEITQDILYTIDINCSIKTFRDVAIGVKEFNEFNNKDSECKEPNIDRLILGVIEQVYSYKNQIKSKLD